MNKDTNQSDIEELAIILSCMREENFNKLSDFEKSNLRAQARTALNKGYRKLPQKIDGGYFGTHCHICHEAVKDCKCIRQSPESSELTNYGDLENHIRCHLEQGTHIPKEDIEPAIRMIMISVRQEVGTQQSNLIPLDEKELSLFLETNTHCHCCCGDYCNCTLPDLPDDVAKLICSKYGSPSVPSLEDIIKLLYQYEDHIEGHPGIISETYFEDLSTAIHRLITNGGKK